MFSTASGSVWRLIAPWRAEAGEQRRQLSFRWQLLFVILGAILPVLTLVGLLLVWGAQQHREIVERGLRDTGQALATAVDRQIDVWEAALDVLAASPALDSDDLSSFYAQATQIAQQHDANIVLFDETFRQRINTLKPYGQPLLAEPRDPEIARQVIATGQPQIVGPFMDQVSQSWTLSLGVPVWREGRIAYDLNMFFKPDTLSNLLSEQELPAGWVAVITNDAHVSVARSKDVATYLGRAASAEFIEAVSSRDEGIVESRLLDGPLRIVAFKKLSSAPWVVATAARADVLAAQTRQPLLIFGGLALAAIGAAAVSAWLFSRRVTRPLASLASTADDVLRCSPARAEPLAIREFEMLRRALEQSGRAALEAVAAREKATALQASADSLRKSEERQRLLARELDHRARNLLSVILSILISTKADDIKTFAAKVEGRIMALAHAHSLLTATRWNGANLGSLIEAELAPYRTSERCIELGGPQVMLSPTAAQTMALALHELTTNAVKYGALSVLAGRLTVTWQVADDVLNVSWRESGGPDVLCAPRSGGFGTVMIRGSVEHELGGCVSLDWTAGGLHATLRIPTTQSAVTVPSDQAEKFVSPEQAHPQSISITG